MYELYYIYSPSDRVLSSIVKFRRRARVMNSVVLYLRRPCVDMDHRCQSIRVNYRRRRRCRRSRRIHLSQTLLLRAACRRRERPSRLGYVCAAPGPRATERGTRARHQTCPAVPC